MRDDKYIEVKEAVSAEDFGIVSTSRLQRQWRLGYNRACHYLSYLVEDGIIRETGLAGYRYEKIAFKSVQFKG